ncbi:MAG: hypothetical protein NC489_40970 [Ruminococcus flavefaciens]|nr:hypothetical protein [Ruminococcus flavefaciens]
MTYLFTDIKKLYRNKLVLFALAILLLVAVIDPVTMRREYAQFGNPFMWWLFMNRGAGSTIFNTLHWFFPVFLTGLVFFDERKTAIYGVLITKKRRSTYFVSKAVSLFIVVFVSLLCLFLLNLLLVSVACPSTMAIEEYLIPKAGTFAAYFFSKSPLCMALFYIVLHALAMALLSVLYLGIHMIMKPKNKYLALIFPPLLMYALNYVTQIAIGAEYSLTYILQPVAASAGTAPVSSSNLIIVFAVLALVDMVCFFIGSRRNRDIV